MFLGGSTALYSGQMAADIYLQPYDFLTNTAENAGKEAHRMPTVCLTWGLSVVFVQTANVPANAQLMPQWQYDNGALPMMHWEFHGVSPFAMPGAYIPQNPEYIYVFEVSAVEYVMSRSIIWHMKTVVSSNLPPHQLFYHESERRNSAHQFLVPPSVKLVGDIKKRVIRNLTFTTQVQQCRLAPPDRRPNEEQEMDGDND